MISEIDVSTVPLVAQQAGDQLIAVRNGAIVRATVPEPLLLSVVAETGNYGDLMGLPDLSLAGLGAAPAALGLLAETAVQPAAIAAFETTTQLNARDAASRDRANHTGTQSVTTIDNFSGMAAAAAPVQSVAGRGGNVTLGPGDVGLGQVDNTPDSAKPISESTQAALDLKLEAGAIATFETATQLDARDAVNRNRANHTGSQAIGTVTGLQMALDLKLEAGAIATFETSTQLNTRDAANRNRANHTGAQAIDTITGLQTALNQKLEAGAIASFETSTALNARDTANRARSNHTGSQAIDTITGLQTALNLKLEAGAIASFETSTQLNARDAVNRNRANHTGAQAIDTITGLQTVLDSKIAIADRALYTGWHYVGATEPINPANGFRWLELTAGGLYKGQWEWITSVALWVSIERFRATGSIFGATGTQTFTYNADLPIVNKAVFIENIYYGYYVVTADNSNYWNFDFLRPNIASNTGALAGGNPALSSLTSIRTGSASWRYATITFNALVTPTEGGFLRFYSQTGKVGAPTNLSLLVVTTMRFTR